VGNRGVNQKKGGVSKVQSRETLKKKGGVPKMTFFPRETKTKCGIKWGGPFFQEKPRQSVE
jgi:hypothetical protein